MLSMRNHLWLFNTHTHVEARQTEETGGCFNRDLTGVFLLFFPGSEKLVPKRMNDKQLWMNVKRILCTGEFNWNDCTTKCFYVCVFHGNNNINYFSKTNQRQPLHTCIWLISVSLYLALYLLPNITNLRH